MRAAVPSYVTAAFETAPPGHRYRLYLPAWNDKWLMEKGKKPKDGESSKKDVIAATAKALDKSGYPELAGRLVERQRAVARSLGDAVLTIDTRSTAPFVTGVGAEHPLETGFAFLDPYGAPYLPGSSVKGVLRRAAEELTLFEPGSGWTLADVWWLFGFDATSAFIGRGQMDAPAPAMETIAQEWRAAYDKACTTLTPEIARAFLDAAAGPKPELPAPWRDDPVGFLRSLGSNTVDAERHARALHLAGSLRFWDVIVVPPGNSLRVDIMNPHHWNYYLPEKRSTAEAPGDFRPPRPIFFLAIPPGARFTFFVELAGIGSLPQAIRERWRDLLRGAIEHACTYLGFGAKTAVGYGALEVEVPAERPSGPSALERLLKELEALPQARLHGAIGPLVRRALELTEPSDQREAAKAIVKKYTLKEARKKAKDKEEWKRILTLAEET